jgi:hypothetical protein
MYLGWQTNLTARTKRPDEERPLLDGSNSAARTKSITHKTNAREDAPPAWHDQMLLIEHTRMTVRITALALTFCSDNVM